MSDKPKRKCKKIIKKLSPPSAEPINFYKLDSVQEFANIQHNPYESIHHLSVPFRGCVIGSSGAGKTNFMLNLLLVMQETFNHVYIFTMAQECLYDYLQSRLPEELLTINYGTQSMEDFDESNFYGSSLVIFDDWVNASAKEHRAVQELFIRGRKIQNGVSCVYLSQSYYKIPKIIRLQCQYIFILKVPAKKDIKLILAEYTLNITIERILDFYKECCKTGQIENFFMIDTHSPEEAGMTFRKNFNQFLVP